MNGSDEMTEDDGSDLLSQMEMKARLDKVGNDPQNTSDRRTHTGDQTQTKLGQGNAIKGEDENDDLQFPLGVRIKKEVLDPREEGEEDSANQDGQLDLGNINAKQRKTAKRQSIGQRPNVIGKMSKLTPNISNSDEDNIQVLKKVVAEIPDVGQIWKAVRPKILSHCQIWDLLMDKVISILLGK